LKSNPKFFQIFWKSEQ